LILTGLVIVAVGCGSSSKPAAQKPAGSTPAGSAPAGSTAATKSPIVIGFEADLTGVSSSVDIGAVQGAQARVDAQNAAGGVDGHPLQLAVKDDTSSPQGDLTAAQALVETDHATVIANISSFTFGAMRYLNQHGIPVMGGAFDGPEWTEQPYSNMFAYNPPLQGPINGTYYTYSSAGEFLKSIGARKFAGLAYGISPSAQEAMFAIRSSADQAGLTNCYTNTSVPFGGVDFTADVLQIKKAGCDVVSAPFVDSSDVALAGALAQGGVTAKQLYFTGYDQNILSSPAARAAMNGAYMQAPVNFTTPNAATQQMLNTIKKYDPSFTGGIPDLGMYAAYLSTDLAIYGLEQAGPNPTSASVISHLRNVSNYTAGGILASPTNFTGFATPAMFPSTSCGYIVQLQGDKFVTANGGKPVCGSRIAVSQKP